MGTSSIICTVRNVNNHKYNCMPHLDLVLQKKTAVLSMVEMWGTITEVCC